MATAAARNEENKYQPAIINGSISLISMWRKYGEKWHQYQYRKQNSIESKYSLSCARGSMASMKVKAMK